MRRTRSGEGACMRIDYFTTTAPWPETTGARLRVGALYEGLGRHGADVRVIVLGERPDADTRRRLEAGGGVVHPSRSDALAAKALRYLRAALAGRDPIAGHFLDARGLERFGRLAAARRPDVVLLGNVFLAPLLPALRALLPEARVIIDNHNVESLLHRRMLARGDSLRVRLPASLVARSSARLEHQYLSRADQVWACSDVDARHLREAHRLPRVHTIPNAVDTDALRGAGEEQGRTIVFTGTLWHPPNDQAARRLIDLSHRLRARGVGHTLYLVGQGPSAALARAARGHPDVIITGAVPDVGTYIARAGVIAAPLEVGSGTKLKLLQAMALGRAIVTTPIGAEGLELRDGHHAIVAEVAQHEAHLARLLHSPEERARLGASARAHAVERFSLAALGRRLGEALDEVLPARRAGALVSVPH